MRLSTGFTGVQRDFEWDEALLFPMDDVEQQARIAIAAWADNRCTGRPWVGRIDSVRTTGNNRYEVHVGGSEPFIFQLLDIGGPW